MKGFTFHPELLNAQFVQTTRIVGIIVFLSIATLFIGFNHNIFKIVFAEKSKSYWWLFALLTIIPFLLVLFVFSFLFGDTPFVYK